MLPQEKVELTPQVLSTILTNMKKQLSQVDGEINTMRADVQSGIFQNTANIIQQLINDKDALQTRLNEKLAILDKIYNGHPDIQISMEREKKEEQEIQNRKAKKVG